MPAIGLGLQKTSIEAVKGKERKEQTVIIHRACFPG